MEDDSTPKLRPTRTNRISVPVQKNPEILKQPMFPPVPQYTFSPILHIDNYIRDAGITGEKEKLYRELYTPPPESEVEIKTKVSVPSDLLTVFTNIKCLKNKVKVKISVPMEPVYAYQKKGKMAPLETRIKAAKGFGYPDSVLEKMIVHNEKVKSQSSKLDEFIDKIFKCTSTKASKPKAKTVQEALTSKFKKKPIKKY
jgi:hypothetical protein